MHFNGCTEGSSEAKTKKINKIVMNKSCTLYNVHCTYNNGLQVTSVFYIHMYV